MASKKASSAGNQQERSMKEKIIRAVIGFGVMGLMYFFAHSISYSVLGTPPLIANIVGITFLAVGFFIFLRLNT